MNSGDGGAAPGYWELLSTEREFRTLFLARLVSLFGDWFNTLAVLMLLRSLGGEGAAAFGWVLILKTLPALFVSPLAGVLADRLPRKAILIGCDLFRAGVVGCMLFVPQLPGGTWLLYGLVIAQTMAMATSEPVRNAVLPDLIPPRSLLTANALNAVMWSTVFTVGVACGGLVTHSFGWQVALVVDLGTYLISAAAIATLRVPAHPAGDGRRLSALTGLADLRDGIRYLAARPPVLSMALAKFGWTLAGGITLVLTILGEERFPLGEGGVLGVTVLYMARGLGTGVGPVVSRRLCGGDPGCSERIIGFAYLWGAAFYLLLGSADSLALAAALVLLAHLGGSTVWVFSTVRLQAQVPTEVRGRVFAAEQACFTFGMAGSTYLFGWAIDAQILPLEQLVSCLGLLLLVPAAAWAWRQRRLSPAATGV